MPITPCLYTVLWAFYCNVLPARKVDQERRFLTSRIARFDGDRAGDKSLFRARAEMAGKNSLFQRVTVDMVAVLKQNTRLDFWRGSRAAKGGRL